MAYRKLKEPRMLFAAEIGSNHKGIPALAFEMIRQAKLAGADIAKFQLRDPDDPIRGMPMHNIERLMEWCNHFDIEFMASVFSHGAIEVAESAGMKRYKIAYSIAVEKPDIVQAVAALGKEVFISHGGYDWPNFKKLFVVAEYPTYPEDMVMPPMFGGEWWGYSSHMHGFADALIAIARGAQYIEKHVTLDKTEASIKDNHFALSFAEFADMVRVGREMGRLIGASYVPVVNIRT